MTHFRFLPAALLCLAFAQTVRADTITQLVIFGDSLSDAGNVSLATGGALPGPGYYAGRYSNGPLWVERLAAMGGWGNATPVLLGGNNFAFAAAGTGDGVSVNGSPNLGGQIDLYLAGLADHGLTQAPDGTLAVVYAGNNDFILYGETNPATSVANIAGQIQKLADAGVTRFLVPNLAPLGSTPGGMAVNEAGLNALSGGFNAILTGTLDQLETDLGVTIHRLDVAGLTQDAMTDPTRFGFTNVTQSALGQGDDGLTHLFWDDFHPGNLAHQLIANRAYEEVTGVNAVPEPSSLALMAIGGVGLLWTRRRPRRVS